MTGKFRPSLIIGLGGTGRSVLTCVKSGLQEANNGSMPPEVHLFAIDTDVQEPQVRATDARLTSDEIVFIGKDLLRISMDVSRGKLPYIATWYPADELLKRMPDSAFRAPSGSGSLRSIGRLALFVDLQAGRPSGIRDRLARLIAELAKQTETGQPAEIVVVSSLFGTTGSAIFADVAILLRSLAKREHLANYTLGGLLVLPSVMPEASQLHQAQAYAAWRELDRLMVARESRPVRVCYSEKQEDLEVTTDRRVFDICYLFGERQGAPTASRALDLDLYPMMGDFVGLLADGLTGQVLADYTITTMAKELGSQEPRAYYSTVGLYTIKNVTRRTSAAAFAYQTVKSLVNPLGSQSSLGSLGRSDLDKSLAKQGREAVRDFWSACSTGLISSLPVAAIQPTSASSQASSQSSTGSTDQLGGILIVTATKAEAQAVLEAFSQTAGKRWTRQTIGNKTYYNLGLHGGTSVYMVQSEMGFATPGGALLTVRRAIQDLRPQAVILCGIGFGLRPDKQELGDILIAKQILYYEPQKVDLQRGEMPRGDRTTSAERLLDRFRSAELDWQGAPTHFGLVVSGEKLANDPTLRDWLLRAEPEAIGGEMEGGGLYVAARDAKVDWILVAAIGDWADGRKDDVAQPLAAHNAAQFVSHVVQLGGWEVSEQPPFPKPRHMDSSTFLQWVASAVAERDKEQPVAMMADDDHQALVQSLTVVLNIDPNDFENELRSLLNRALQDSQDDPTGSVVARIEESIAILYETKFGRAGIDNMRSGGQLQVAQNRRSSEEIERFADRLLAYLLLRLNGVEGQPVLARAGALSFLEVFLRALVEDLKWLGEYLITVRTALQECSREADASLKASSQKLDDYRQRRFLLALQDYEAALFAAGRAERDKYLLREAINTIAAMSSHAASAYEAVQTWIVFLGSEPSPGSNLRGDLLQLAKRESEGVGKVWSTHRLEAGQTSATTAAMLSEGLGRVRWTSATESLTEVDLVPVFEASGQRYSLSPRRGRQETVRALLEWAEAVLTTSAPSSSFSELMLTEFPSPKSLAAEVNDRIEPRASYNSLYAQMRTSSDFVFFPQQHTPELVEYLDRVADEIRNASASGGWHVSPVSQEMCAFLRLNDLLAGESFLDRKASEIGYTQRMGSSGSMEAGRMLHVFPNEANATAWEVRRASQGTELRRLHPRLVEVMEDNARLILFFRAVLCELILDSEEGYMLALPERHLRIKLTDPSGRRDISIATANFVLDLLDAVFTFVSLGYDIRPGGSRNRIDYDQVRDAINNIQQKRDTWLRAQLAQASETVFLQRLRHEPLTSESLDQRQLRQDLVDVVEMICEDWRRDLQAKQEAASRRSPIAHIEDLYVAGPALTPAVGSLFVGRQKIFKDLETTWRNPLQKAPIVLHGQRRMGKTSVLYHLGARLGPDFITVMLDLQGLCAEIEKPQDLWAGIARLIQNRLQELSMGDSTTAFASGVSSLATLSRFLDEVERRLGDQYWLVLMFDEFEKLEEKIESGIVPISFLEYLRSMMQHRQRFLILLAGHHTLQERMKEYWGPLMGVAKAEHLRYLSESESRQLITAPWDGYQLGFEPQAIDRLVQACGGQPMLLQLACSNVVDLVNERLERDGGELSPKATLKEVNLVLDRMGQVTDDEASYYFDAVWHWLKDDEQTVLKKAARLASDSASGRIQPSSFSDAEKAVLQRLADRDVLEDDNHGYRFRVELVGRWASHQECGA